jgi:hypothetical protein
MMPTRCSVETIMTPTDPLLMAYVDGELDADARARLDAQLANDPQLAARVRRERDLRARMQAAFDGVLQEPVPQRLLDVVSRAEAGVASVSELAARRVRGPEVARWPRWSALAASVLLGLILGAALYRSQFSGPLVLRDGQMLAQGALRAALDTQLARDRPASGAQVGYSFLSKSGDYCRSFTLTGQDLSGIACRSGGQWQVQATARPAAAAVTGEAGGLRMAASPWPEALTATGDALRAGDPLDAEAERQAVQRGWTRP